MAVIVQLRRVPDALHRQMKACAALAGMSLSDYLIRELRKLAEQPTVEEMAERLAARKAVVPRISPAQALRHERESR